MSYKEAWYEVCLSVRGQEVAMITGIIKALLTPALLGLGVAMLIRAFGGRRTQ
jgi:hypothetical protein